MLASLVVAAVERPGGLEPGPYELVVLSGRDDSIGGQRQQLVDEWNALHPESKARIVELSSRADAQRSEMLARAQSDGSAGAGVDVYNLDVTWTAEFADAGYVTSLDESQVSTDGFLAGPLSTCRYGGRLWALPFNADVGLLYYRTDLLEQIGQTEPPRDWDTLVAQAALVRARTGGSVAGYVGQAGDYEGQTVTALEMIWGAGGTVVDDDGRVLPDQRDADAVRAGLDRLRALGPPGLPELDEDAGREAFRAGRALFMRNWPVSYRALLQQPQEGAPVPFDVAPLPGGSAALGGQNLAVSSRTAHPRAARALVAFLTGERSEQLLFERGGLPATRTSVYYDPQVKAAYPFAERLREAFDRAHRRPTVAHYAQFSQAFRADALTYLRNNEPLDETRLRDDLEEALKGRWPRVGS